MNITKLDTFLNISFKVGKVISTTILTLALLIGIGCGIGMLYNSFHKLDTPSFSKTEKEFEAQLHPSSNRQDELETPQNDTKNSDNKYIKQIQKIITQNKLDPKVKDDIEKGLKLDVAVGHERKYLNGLNIFIRNGLKYVEKESKAGEYYISNTIYSQMGDNYESYKQFLSNKNIINKDGRYNYYLCAGLVVDYTLQFIDNVEQMEKAKSESADKNNTLLITLGIVTVFFILFLYLPILIRIEENTRKLKEYAQTSENAR